MNGLSTLSVMVVDPDPWTRHLITSALNESGVQVRHASNGMTALRLALASAPHVMLLGSALPELSTTELIGTLRSEARTSQTAIVGLPEVRGADAELRLPCTSLEVLATLVEALESRRQAVAPIRSVIASPRGTWPSTEADAVSRSSSRMRNGGRSAKWRFSSGIDTL